MKESDPTQNTKEGRTTRLIVEKGETVRAVRDDTGVRFEAKGITLGRSKIEGSFSYYKLRNLSNTHTIELLIREGEGTKAVSLPSSMLDRVAEYIRNENNLSDYNLDCSAFAHFVNDVPHRFANFILDGVWKVEDYEESTLVPGDTILLLKDSTEPVHFAIYIGDGLYISKFGTSGRLIATNVEEMKKGFEANKVIKILPESSSVIPQQVNLEKYKK